MTTEEYSIHELCELIRANIEEARPDADRVIHWATKLKAALALQGRYIADNERPPVRFS